jgi:hypothetical protein
MHQPRLHDRGEVDAAHQGRRGEAVAAQRSLEKVPQPWSHTGQAALERHQPLASCLVSGAGHGVNGVLAEQRDETIQVLAELVEPGVEVRYPSEAEAEPGHRLARTGRQFGEQFLEAGQQVQLGQYHVQRQACAQFGAQLVQARAHLLRQRLAIGGRAIQQLHQIHHQYHPIQGAAAAFLAQPVQQMRP